MERKAHYALIGLFTFAVVAGAFGFIFWLHHSSGKKQAVAYRIIFDSSVSGLQVGGNVLFNGIRVGEVTNLRLDPDKPSQVIALLAVNKATPIRSDTKVGLEFQGLTGVAAVSLKGVSATTPLIEREEGEPPTLKADPSASQDMMQAARDVLNKAEEVITANQEALHQAIKDIAHVQRIARAQLRQRQFDHEQHQCRHEQCQGSNGIGAHADRKSRQAHRRNHDRREQNDGDRDAANRYRRQGDHGPRAQSAALSIRRQWGHHSGRDDAAGSQAAVNRLRPPRALRPDRAAV